MNGVILETPKKFEVYVLPRERDTTKRYLEILKGTRRMVVDIGFADSATAGNLRRDWERFLND